MGVRDKLICRILTILKIRHFQLHSLILINDLSFHLPSLCLTGSNPLPWVSIKWWWSTRGLNLRSRLLSLEPCDWRGSFDSVCKIFEALFIIICVSCGSSSISDINLFHALHYAQPRSTRRLLLQGASKLDCTPSLDKYFPPFVSVNHCYKAVIFCPSKSIFGEVDYMYLLSDGSSPLPWASIKVSQSIRHTCDVVTTTYPHSHLESILGHLQQKPMLLDESWSL